MLLEDSIASLDRTAISRIEREGSRSNAAIFLMKRNQGEESQGDVQKRGFEVGLSDDDARGGAVLSLHHRRGSSFSHSKENSPGQRSTSLDTRISSIAVDPEASVASSGGGGTQTPLSRRASKDPTGRDASTGKDSGAYRVLYGSVCAVAFVNAMTYSVIGPFLPAYVSERFGSTSAEVGMVMAAYPAVNLVTSPMVGLLLVRFGRWKVLLAGLLTLAVSTALYGVAPSVAFLFLASGLHGGALSLVHVSSLGLLSTFPERITESMAGIEVWSGVALVIAPPLGSFVYPLGGVPGVFLLMAAFPVILLFFASRVKHLDRSAKGDKCKAEGTQAGLSPWKVSRNRGVIAGAFVTAFNYAVLGFLEVTLAPHLEQTLSTCPRTIGLVLILPSVLYTMAALKAELVVDRIGVKKTLLSGLGLIGASFIFYGPSPALIPALVTRRAARGAIVIGMLIFEIGSALANVPAFTAMHEGVAGMGPGANDMVASMHAMSIGIGEVLGPLLGGFAAEHLPASPNFACDPDVLLRSDTPMVQDLPVKPSEQKTPPSNVETLEKQKDEKEGPRMTWETMTASVTASVDRDSGDVLLLPPPSNDGRKPRSNDMEADVGLDSGNGVVEASVELGMDVTNENGRRLLLIGRPGTPFEVWWEEGVEGGMVVENSRHLRHKKISKRQKATAPRLEYSNRGGHVEGRTEEGGGDGRDRLMREPADFAVSRGVEGRDDGVEGEERGVSEGDSLSCDSSFPLSATLVAWASCFAALVAYRLLPRHRPELVADD